MKNKAIINITVYQYEELPNTGLDPNYNYSARSAFVIEGDSREDCLEKVRKFHKDNKILILKETSHG